MSQTHRDVVASAYSYLADIVPPSQKISDVRIEEVQPPSTPNARPNWKVVLSYENIGDTPFDRTRESKSFTVSDTDGHVISMTAVNEG